MHVRLISVTQPVIEVDGRKPTPEELMVYVARVSNPSNQGNLDTAPRLLRYCIRNGHWSVFEGVHCTVEIETSRAIAAQILRHRSFTFQEFSQRYAEADLGFEAYEARRQDTKNRQSSHDDLPDDIKEWFKQAQDLMISQALDFYDRALDYGIAKEQARFLLPLSVKTRLYMTGSVRSWIHYLESRTAPGTQKEHRDVAEAVRDIFSVQFPNTYDALSEMREA